MCNFSDDFKEKQMESHPVANICRGLKWRPQLQSACYVAGEVLPNCCGGKCLQMLLSCGLGFARWLSFPLAFCFSASLCVTFSLPLLFCLDASYKTPCSSSKNAIKTWRFEEICSFFRKTPCVTSFQESALVWDWINVWSWLGFQSPIYLHFSFALALFRWHQL